MGGKKWKHTVLIFLHYQLNTLILFESRLWNVNIVIPRIAIKKKKKKPSSGLANFNPQVKFGSLPNKDYWSTAMFTCLHIACDCFCPVVAKLSTGLNTWNVVLYRTSLPTSGLEANGRDQWNARKSQTNPEEGNKRRKEQRTDETNSKIVELNSTISPITLNLNGLNTTIYSKNVRFVKKVRPSWYCVQDNFFRY